MAGRRPAMGWRPAMRRSSVMGRMVGAQTEKWGLESGASLLCRRFRSFQTSDCQSAAAAHRDVRRRLTRLTIACEFLRRLLNRSIPDCDWSLPNGIRQGPRTCRKSPSLWGRSSQRTTKLRPCPLSTEWEDPHHPHPYPPPEHPSHHHLTLLYQCQCSCCIRLLSCLRSPYRSASPHRHHHPRRCAIPRNATSGVCHSLAHFHSLHYPSADPPGAVRRGGTAMRAGSLTPRYQSPSSRPSSSAERCCPSTSRGP